ncbi:MAG: insulinase family protein, partial [Myxococcales bacterium]|nr:insulinase family protein [Myxococcales bacterium]
MSGAAKIVLDGGVPCYVEPQPTLPIVSVSALLRTGAALDPPGKDGLSRVTARALRRG